METRTSDKRGVFFNPLLIEMYLFGSKILNDCDENENSLGTKINEIRLNHVPNETCRDKG